MVKWNRFLASGSRHLGSWDLDTGMSKFKNHTAYSQSENSIEMASKSADHKNMNHLSE